MKSPKRGTVFTCEMKDTKYMSVMDRMSKNIRCISADSKKQTVVSRSSIDHVYTPEESQEMLHLFF